MDAASVRFGAGRIRVAAPVKTSDVRARPGFHDGDCGTHSSRTLMFAELELLLEATAPDAAISDYRRATVEQNVLGKRTRTTREHTVRKLKALYGLDSVLPVFRALRTFWPLDNEALREINPKLSVSFGCFGKLFGDYAEWSDRSCSSVLPPPTTGLRGPRPSGETQAYPPWRPPCGIFVRWKPIEQQPPGWDPDINDGVGVNIRPFMRVGDVGKKGAGILREKPNIDWGKDPAGAPW